jgi:hypothetical protein
VDAARIPESDESPDARPARSPAHSLANEADTPTDPDGVPMMQAQPSVVVTEEFLDVMRVFAMSQSCMEDALASARFQAEVLGVAEDEPEARPC